MRTLLWAEGRKLRRSRFVLLAFFAAVMTAFFVLTGGGLMDPQSGWTKAAGGYLTMAQPWATLMVFPAVAALLGSYSICREEQDGALKSLLLVPVSESRMTAAKMTVAFGLCVVLYLTLFLLVFLGEAAIHPAEVSAGLFFHFLRTYVLEGAGVFLAVSPVIAAAAYRKKNWWAAFAVAELYSFAGLFMSISGTLRTFYPITAAMGVAGYYETDSASLTGSCVSLLLCAGGAAALLTALHRTETARGFRRKV